MAAYIPACLRKGSPLAAIYRHNLLLALAVPMACKPGVPLHDQWLLMPVQAYQGGCTQSFIHTLNYTQVAGLFAGMVALGFSIDRLGRRLGSIFTSCVMFVGTYADTVRSVAACVLQCCIHMQTMLISFAVCDHMCLGVPPVCV